MYLLAISSAIDTKDGIIKECQFDLDFKDKYSNIGIQIRTDSDPNIGIYNNALYIYPNNPSYPGYGHDGGKGDWIDTLQNELIKEGNTIKNLSVSVDKNNLYIKQNGKIILQQTNKRVLEEPYFFIRVQFSAKEDLVKFNMTKTDQQVKDEANSTA